MAYCTQPFRECNLSISVGQLIGENVKLLDTLKEKYELKNDAEVSRRLGVPPPIISKIRHGKANVSAEIILRIHENLGMPVADIRALM